MLKQHLLLAALVWLVMHTAQGATKPSSKITRFRPITQSEYDAVLSLTDGKPVVSEGRLIASGFSALVGLTTGWMTSLRLSNLLASVGLAQKSNDDSYPLCVIKNEGTEHVEEQHEHHSHHQHHHYSDDTYYTPEDEHHPNYHEHYHEADSHEHDSSGEHYDYHDHEHEHVVSIDAAGHKNKLSPVVNCIVVLKKDKNTNNHEHYHPTGSQKHPQHYSPYPYHESGVQSSPGSYNNHWHWQSPYYHPYYSNSRFYTNPYPFAYTNIYGPANPSSYPINYPGIIPNPFTATFAGNNPRFGNEPLTSGAHPFTASSTSAIDTFNTQSSGDTSDYSGIENVEALEYNRPDVEEEASYATPQVNYAAYTENEYSDGSSAPRKFKNFPLSKIPMKLVQTISKSTSKRQHQKQPLSSSSLPSTKAHNSSKRTKTKRDESAIQSNSYAKLATHSQGGYQPKPYPKSRYPSTYPKISYMQPLPYSAPVYVKSSHQLPVGGLKMSRYQESEADSEEDEDENDFIQARVFSRQDF